MKRERERYGEETREAVESLPREARRDYETEERGGRDTDRKRERERERGGREAEGGEGQEKRPSPVSVF